MKIDIDNILGSARNLKNQRQIDEGASKEKKGGVKSDSVKIESRLNSRIDLIQRELNEIQTSLTRNQIIRRGIESLQQEISRGGENREKILDEFKFEGRKELRFFVGDALSPEGLNTKYKQVSKLVSDDVSKLTRLQIEIENIMASDIAKSGKVQNLMQTLEDFLSGSGNNRISAISNLKADTVMRLIR